MKKICLLLICLPILAVSQVDNECYRSNNKTFKDSVIQEMFRLVNQHRLDHNLNKFIWDKKLQKACKKHSMYQAYEDRMCHWQHNKKNPYYESKYPQDRSNAKRENVAYGYYFNSKDYNPSNKKIKNAKEIAFDIFTLWKESPGHNRNMIDPNLIYFAFDYYAYVHVKTKYYDKFYSAQLFR